MDFGLSIRDRLRYSGREPGKRPLSGSLTAGLRTFVDSQPRYHRAEEIQHDFHVERDALQEPHLLSFKQSRKPGRESGLSF